MTIRFTCSGCGSLLKIKEELAGTDGKCPKCKTEFVVPNSMADEDSRELLVMPSEPTESHAKSEKKSERRSERPAAPAATTPAEPIAEKSAKLAVKPKKSGAPKDFDPADFLMGDGERPRLPLPGDDSVSELDDDDEVRRPAPVENRPKRPVTKPPSSGTIATAAGGGTGISASAHAKEMMMKAMEDSRLHAGDAPPEEPKEGFDYAGMFRELGLKGGLGLVAVILVSYGIYVFFDSMMGGKLTLPQLGYVTGVVTLDGNPLPGATVYFAPLEAEIPGTKRERARTSFGITDEKGAYTMIYIGKTQGVAVGKCRVWLDLIGPTGQMIPPDYTEGVMQVRDVKPGSQQFPFNMSSAR
jgi:phage FluMu protein Com